MTNTVHVIIAAVVAVAIVGSAAALAWHGTLSGAQFLGVTGTVVGLPALGLGGVAVAKQAAKP